MSDTESNPFKVPHNPRIRSAALTKPNYFNLPIAEKTRISRHQNVLNAAQLRREDKEIFGTENPLKCKNLRSNIPILPASFRPRQTEGVKSFLEKTRATARISMQIAMKESEIAVLNEEVVQKMLYLQKQEKLLLQKEIDEERRVRERDEKAHSFSAQNENSGQILENCKLKIEDLQRVLDAVFVEVSREVQQLELCVRGRDLIWSVANMGPTAEEAQGEQAGLEGEIEKFQEGQIQVYKSQKGKQGVQDKYLVLRQYEIIEKSKQFFNFADVEKIGAGGSAVMIDFDFKEFIANIDRNFKLPEIRMPIILQAQNDVLLTETDQDGNLFEKYAPNSLQEEQISKVILLLRRSNQLKTRLIFSSVNDFNQNISLLEQTNLIRTNNLQDLQFQIEENHQIFIEKSEKYSEVERGLQHTLNELLSEKSHLKIKNQPNVKASFFDDERSPDVQYLDRLISELMFTHSAIIAAGFHSGLLSQSDYQLHSNTVLTRYEVDLDRLQEEFIRFSAKTHEVSRRELAKIRREQARSVKSRELQMATARVKARHTGVKNVGRSVVERTYAVQKKTTKVQKELELKLKMESKNVVEDEDFYV